MTIASGFDHAVEDNTAGVEHELPPPSDPMRVAGGLVAARFLTHEGRLSIHFWRGEFWSWRGSHSSEVDESAVRAEAYRFTEHAVYRNSRGDQVVWAPTRNKIADLVDALKAVLRLGAVVEMPVWLDGPHPVHDLSAAADVAPGVVSSSVVRVGPDGPRRLSIASSTNRGRPQSQDPREDDETVGYSGAARGLSGPGRPPADEVVACANGLLHVPTRRLMDHDASFFNQVSIPFHYLATPPVPTRWVSFLGELWPGDPEAIMALQEWFGYIVSGRTGLQKSSVSCW